MRCDNPALAEVGCDCCPEVIVLLGQALAVPRPSMLRLQAQDGGPVDGLTRGHLDGQHLPRPSSARFKPHVQQGEDQARL